MSRAPFTVELSDRARRILEDSSNVRERLSTAIADVFRKQAQFLAGHVVKTQLSGVKGPNPSRSPNKALKRRRTGSMARGVAARALKENGLPTIQVGVFQESTAKDYLPLQEFGTRAFNSDSPFDTIRPRNAKALTMPVGDAVLTPAGVPRFDARSSPSPLEPVYFRRPGGKRGNVIGKLVFKTQMMEEQERASLENREPDFRLVPAVFLLLTELDIRPGYFILDGSLDYMPTLQRAIADALEEVV